MWIEDPRPLHVLPLLRAVSQEQLLQHEAELEVATVAAASNILFRACVQRKVQQIRTRHLERRARQLAQEQERQRLIEEARLREEQRFEAWLGTEMARAGCARAYMCVRARAYALVSTYDDATCSPPDS